MNTSVSIVPTVFQVPSSRASTKFRLIKLQNGLTALLICDIDAKSTAVSLTINAGSNKNNGVLGLAHLIEHMVFGGSKQFPEPYHLLETVFGAGGSANASTTHDQTNYHFEVPLTASTAKELNPKVKSDEPLLEYALKVFASLFNEPLFPASLIKREINEVNEEHMANIRSQEKQFYHCLKLLSSPNYSFHDFSTGTADSLSSIPKIRAKLVSFFTEHYGPQNMKVVIKSPLSLYYLQKLVAVNFGSLASLPTRFSVPPVLFQGQTSRLVHVVKEEDPKARIIFPVSRLNDTVIQIVKFWVEILGQETPGSLCDFLVSSNLASFVSVFKQMIDINNLVLIIEVSLTKRGIANIATVISSVFSYTRAFLESAPEAIQESFEEFVKVERLRFIYEDQASDCLTEVTTLCENLRQCPASNILQGYKPVEEIKEDIIVLETKKWLTPQNMNVILMSARFIQPDFVISQDDVCFDKYYKFDYQEFLLDKKSILKTSNHLGTNFKPLTRNPFFSFTTSQLHQLSVVFDESQPISPFNVSLVSNKPPVLLENSNNHELWYKAETDFNSKICATFQVVSKTLPYDCFTFVSIELICEVLKGYIQTALYQSESIGFTWSTTSMVNGTNSICFNLNGLKFNFVQVLDNFIDAVNHFMGQLHKVPYTVFRMARVHLRNHYESVNNAGLLEKCIAFNVLLAEENIYTIEELCDVLESLTVESIAKVALVLLQNVYTNIFVNGDTTTDTTYAISNTINKLSHHMQSSELVAPPDPRSYWPITGTFRIPIFSNFQKTNNFCYLYVHLGDRSDSYTRAFSRLVDYILAKASYWLRTQKNLAYRTATGLRVFRQTIGLFVYLESSTHPYQALASHIEDYLCYIVDDLRSMSQTEFQTSILQPFIDSLNRTSDNVLSPSYLFDMPPTQSSTNFNTSSKYFLRHKSCWEKITTRSYRFEGKNGFEQVDPELVQNTTTTELIHYFNRRIINGPSRSSILVTNPANTVVSTMEEPQSKIKRLFKKQQRHQAQFSVRTIDVQRYHDNCEVVERRNSGV